MSQYMKSGRPKQAYSLAEAAETLGVSKGHLRNEHSRGNLRIARSGRRLLVSANEIQRYLDRCEATGVGPDGSSDA